MVASTVSRKVIHETQLQPTKRTRTTRKKAAHARVKIKLSSAPSHICLQWFLPMKSEDAIPQRGILDPELLQGQYMSLTEPVLGADVIQHGDTT